MPSPSSSVNQEQLRNLDSDANGIPVNPNATFDLPTESQPPELVQLGLEVRS
jgi:hypothetical protein